MTDTAPDGVFCKRKLLAELHGAEDEVSAAVNLKEDGAALGALAHLLRKVSHGGDRLHVRLDDDVAFAQVSGSGGLVFVNAEDGEAAVLDLEGLGFIPGEGTHGEAERAFGLLRFAAIPGLDAVFSGEVLAAVAELHGEFLRGAFTPHGHLRVGAGSLLGDGGEQFSGILDVLAVNGDDHVAFLDAGLVGGLAFLDTGHEGAMRILHIQGLGGVFIDILDHDTEPAAADLLAALELGDDVVGEVAGHGEADALAGSDDGGIDADDLTLHIQKGTAGVAGVNGAVGLQEVVKGAGVDAAALGRKNAGGDGMVKTEGVADGEEPFADLQVCGAAELQEGQLLVHVNLQESEVGFLIGADELRLDGLTLVHALVEGDTDGVGVGNHVVVGDDVAVSGNQETGAQGLLLALGSLLSPVVEGTAEETVESGGHVAEHIAEHVFRAAHVGGALGIDVDDGRTARGGELGEIGKILSPGCLGQNESRQNNDSGKSFFQIHTVSISFKGVLRVMQLVCQKHSRGRKSRPASPPPAYILSQSESVVSSSWP